MPTLLIVDDETNILTAFRRVFRGGDVEVITAETAADGLEIARQRRPDTVVLDVHLPTAQASKCCASCRRSTPVAPSCLSPARARPTRPSRR